MKKPTVTELQAEIDRMAEKLAMVEKGLFHWHNEALTLTDENRKLRAHLSTAKLETSTLKGELEEAWESANRYHRAYHYSLQLLEQLKNEKK